MKIMILDLNQDRIELAFSALYMFNKKFFMKYQEKYKIRISFDFHRPFNVDLRYD